MATEVGLNDVIVGTGLFTCRPIEPVETLVPLLAVIDVAPAVMSWLAGTTAVTCVLLR